MNQDNNNVGGRIGRLFFGWAITLTIIMFIANYLLDQSNNPNQHISSYTNPDGRTELVLKQNRHGHYVATGMINGHTVTFLLDTGATSVSIPASIANAIGLKRGYPYQASTANGVIQVYSTQIDNIRLGNIVLHDVHGSINPHMAGTESILLGMSFLRHVEMTQRGNTLILRQ